SFSGPLSRTSRTKFAVSCFRCSTFHIHLTSGSTTSHSSSFSFLMCSIANALVAFICCIVFVSAGTLPLVQQQTAPDEARFLHSHLLRPKKWYDWNDEDLRLNKKWYDWQMLPFNENVDLVKKGHSGPINEPYILQKTIWF
ncbi:hypothetical protein Tcan_00193, partial [Toxocara canis]